MHELKIDVSQYGTRIGLVANIHSALSLGLPEFTISPYCHDGTFVIVGSGPTVKDHIEEIRADYDKGRPIVGVKGGYDFLIENDIIPTFYVSTEPRIRPIEHPHKNSIYLLASRCDPQTFKDLEGYDIILWHSWSAVEYENEAIGHHTAVGGGTTSGLRSVNLGYLMGFRNFHFYGMDSCLTENEKRVGQGSIHEAVTTTDVIVGGRTFMCTMAMAQQADDFQSIYEFIPDVHIKSFGDGLITAIIEERKKSGMPH